ncbi:N-acetylmuramoyl-L-alanine amidase family protein [Bdellovibrio svalbardensis]|uniref:N-acetylmuramoyl-L-alanine amidase n=1 Tax=Bdellovibrio svalbardensis TaxID=2972972 RepID=A0ABT6DGD6_9BACT|nr:N-acetylmuramoyl-L-alanine amidase [Bdellovibrio svalbardensis]MDG0815918.1 N-acetylmuramoyl-L-alanine amidase [Bdellovibrio svalbardensis]
MNILNLRQLIAAIAISGLWAGPASAFHIVIDPGHGGTDTGAVHSNIKEADLVLKVANKLKALLEKNEKFKVTMTRAADRNISLPDRVKLAEGSKADLFVSLHANAASDQRAKGVEFFFQNNLPPDEESLFLASQENQAVLNSMHATDDTSNDLSKKGDVAAIVEDLRRQNRITSSLRLTQTLTQTWENDVRSSQATIKQAPFYVISKTSMPSVLIEVGFLTNPREAKRLTSADYQSDLAQKIYTALVSYKEKVDKAEAKTLN